MENKWQAIDRFWNSFGIPAYDESSVPQGATMPYITYHAEVASFEEPVLLTASIWYRDTSWEAISLKADEIYDLLDEYAIFKVQGGYIFMNKGTPFAQRLADEDDSVRRVIINIEAEFFMK